MPAAGTRKSGKKGQRGRKPGQGNTVSSASRAGTIFGPSRCNRWLRQGRYSERQSASAGAFMAAVLEYLTSEIFELAGEICLKHRNKTIMPKHINLALRGDSELAKLTAATTITDSSVLHHINPALLPVQKGKKAEE